MTLQFRSDTDKLLLVPGGDALQNECCCEGCDDPPCQLFWHSHQYQYKSNYCREGYPTTPPYDYNPAISPWYIVIGNTDYIAAGSPGILSYEIAGAQYVYDRNLWVTTTTLAESVDSADIIGTPDIDIVITNLSGSFSVYNGPWTLTHFSGLTWRLFSPLGVGDSTFFHLSADFGQGSGWIFAVQDIPCDSGTAYLLYKKHNQNCPVSGVYELDYCSTRPGCSTCADNYGSSLTAECV